MARAHRLPEAESRATVPIVNRDELLDLAARLSVQGMPWLVVAIALDVDVETLTTWRDSRRWREAYLRATEPLRARVALNLAWVARDSANRPDQAADMFVVADDLCTDRRTARWWLRCAPEPGVFRWEAVQRLIRRGQRRQLEFGQDSIRQVKGLDVSLDTPADPIEPDDAPTLHEFIGDPRQLALERQLEARLEVEVLVGRAGLAPRQSEIVAELVKRGGPGYGTLAELACELGLSEGAVRRYWHDAAAKVRRAASG